MKEIDEYYNLVREFITFIETTPISIDTLDRYTEFLLRLYLGAISLPALEPDSVDSDIDRGQIIFHPQVDLPDSYHEVYDPFAENPEAELVMGSLSDDFHDIYKDLYEGKLEYEAGNINNACFDWRWGVDDHWGNHAVDALRALHWLRTD